MSVKTILVFLSFCFLLSISNMQSATVYVDASAPGPTYNGTSWGNAYKYLQDALNNANPGDEIWVAAGTYYPDEGQGQNDDDRTSVFGIPQDFTVYGGFDGTETLLTQRDFVNNITILSGDIGTVDDNTDNAYHVVKFMYATSTTILDGFTITKGYADGDGSVDSPNSCGGGIYNDGSGSGYSSNPTIQNCIIKDNYAEYQGGGVHNESNVDETPSTAGEASPSFSDCTFSNNSTGLDGAGVNNEGEFGGVASPTFSNCTFESNSATDQGGAVYNDAEEGTSSPTFTGCTFTSNSAANGGGAMYSDATTSGVASPTITNCTFTGNTAANGGAMFNYANGGTSSPTISGCTFHQNSSTSLSEKGGAILNEGYPGTSSPTITNCTFTENTADRGGAICNYGRDYSGDDGESSPTITNCIFQGNNATGNNGFGGALFNYGRSSGYSSPIVTNCLFTGNVADYGAAVFNYDGVAQYINCSISGNLANTEGVFYSDFYTTDSEPDIYNSIIWNNSGVSIFTPDAVTTVNYSDIENSGGSANWDSNYGTDGGNNIDEDPLFETEINPNDAPTTTGSFVLYNTSPCLDVADDNANSESYDLRGSGFSRKLDKDDYTQVGTIDMGCYEYKQGTDPTDCQAEVWIDGDYTDQTTGWGVTHFNDITLALDNTCPPGTVNISNYSYTGDVDMTGRTFIIGEQDFELIGNLTGGQIRVINTGALLIKDLSSSVTKTFPITDGIYNYTMTLNTDDNSSPDISVRISDLDPSGNFNNDFWDINGPTNLDATLTLRVDKAAIAPKTLNSNTQVRYYDTTNSRYVVVDGNNFSIEEFDTYYIITITGVDEF